LPYIILVDFEIRPAAVGLFIELVTANARSSLQEEAGCRRFDVHRTVGNPDRILLYEIYDDRNAFERHMSTPHFHQFDAAVESLVVSKSVLELEQLNLALADAIFRPEPEQTPPGL
jgi:(4S)-4-hydroxy-5-phosphonooxypentane-2,3-dione isomerase